MVIILRKNLLGDGLGEAEGGGVGPDSCWLVVGRAVAGGGGPVELVVVGRAVAGGGDPVELVVVGRAVAGGGDPVELVVGCVAAVAKPMCVKKKCFKTTKIHNIILPRYIIQIQIQI
jgi:hypothetical protein